jgi:hypothetical protein
MDKINKIKQILSKYHVTNINIPNFLVDDIYNLIVNNIKCDVDSLNNDIMYLYSGIYYTYIEQNNELVKKYYLKAIDCGNDSAMNNLAHYYYNCDVNNNFNVNNELAIKYYIMAINKGNTVALHNLGSQYVNINYEMIDKYYSLINTNTKEHNCLVNMLLNKNFNIDFALRVYDFLNLENIDKLKQNISFVLL